MEDPWLVAFIAIYLSYFATKDASEKIRDATSSLDKKWGIDSSNALQIIGLFVLALIMYVPLYFYMHLPNKISIPIVVLLPICAMIWWGIRGGGLAAPDVSTVKSRSGLEITKLALLATCSALAFAIELGEAAEKVLLALLHGRWWT